MIATVSALGGCGFIIMLFESPPLCYLGLSIFAVALSSMAGGKTYTRVSLYVLLLAVFEEFLSGKPSYLFPALLINFVAISTSFHSAYLFDRTCFSRMTAFCKWSMPGFWARDFLVHVLPILLLGAWVKIHKQQYLELYGGSARAVGLFTGIIHLLWAYLSVGTLDLSNVYIEMSPEIWDGMWCVSIVSHMIGGWLWCFL